jgi:hypothetical protein
MGPSGFTSHLRERCAAGFLSPLKSIALAGFEPANFGSSGKHTNRYTTKPTPVTFISEIAFYYETLKQNHEQSFSQTNAKKERNEFLRQ